MDATTGRGDPGNAHTRVEPAPTSLRLCEPYDTRQNLTDQLDRLREQLQTGEREQRRAAEELGRLRHEIGLVRARLREAPPDVGVGDEPES